MKISAVILLAILFAACSKSSSNPATPSSGDISFSNQVQPIFSASCAIPGCHLGTSAQQGMDLSSGNAYNNIVNVKSIEVPSFYRVKPSSSDSSYLYMKITGASGISGVQMPKTGSISQSQIQTIKDWIDQGAKNN